VKHGEARKRRIVVITDLGWLSLEEVNRAPGPRPGPFACSKELTWNHIGLGIEERISVRLSDHIRP
jgi:hypothetical protein